MVSFVLYDAEDVLDLIFLDRTGDSFLLWLQGGPGTVEDEMVYPSTVFLCFWISAGQYPRPDSCSGTQFFRHDWQPQGLGLPGPSLTG